MKNDNKTARDVTIERGHSVRVADWLEDGIRVLILSIGGVHYCVYLGVPLDHPLAFHDYHDLAIDCHGGLTFSDKGDGAVRPKEYYWYGWDYGHLGDFSYFTEDSKPRKGEKDWTLKEVKDDARLAIYEMRELIKLSESIYSKAKQGGVYVRNKGGRTKSQSDYSSK